MEPSPRVKRRSKLRPRDTTGSKWSRLFPDEVSDKVLNKFASPMTKNYLMLNFHEKLWKIKNFYFSRKSLRKAPEGPWRPPKALGRGNEDFLHMKCGAWEIRKSSPKSASHNTSMALHRPPQVRSSLSVNFFGSKTDRPAQNKVSAASRLIMTATAKSSLHQGSNAVLNKVHEMHGTRNKAVSYLTKFQIKLLTNLPRPWQKTFWCRTFMKNDEKL